MLPCTFRYYDFILNYIKENMAPQRLEFFGLKKAMQRYFKHSSDVQRKVLEKLGFTYADRLTSRQEAVNIKRRKEIDH